MIIEPDRIEGEIHRGPGHLQIPEKVCCDDDFRDRRYFSEHDNDIVEVGFCIPTNEEIEDIYRENAYLVREVKAKLLKSVLRPGNPDAGDDSSGCYPLLHTELDDQRQEVIDQIEDLIREEYIREITLTRTLEKHYKKLYHEWIERKNNSHKSQYGEDNSTESSVKQPKRIGNLSPQPGHDARSQVTTRKRLHNLGFRRGGIASDSVKTEAEFQAVLEFLSGKNDDLIATDDKLAVEPDLIIDPNELEMARYINFNDYVPDFGKDFTRYEEKMVSTWTETEYETFYRRFLMYGKDFCKIASFLPNKSVRACVHYYYREKIKLRLSRIARKSLKQRKRILNNRVSLDKLNLGNSHATEWSSFT